MPFRGFSDFADCLEKLQLRGYSESVARRICGALQRDAEKTKKAGMSSHADCVARLRARGHDEASAERICSALQQGMFVPVSADESLSMDAALQALSSLQAALELVDAYGKDPSKIDPDTLQTLYDYIAEARDALSSVTKSDSAAPAAGVPGALEASQAPEMLQLPPNEVLIAMAVWNRAYINDLPDANFLYVESGGEKDSEGKTVPRSLRHFPYKDKNGKVDLPHLRNAIARIPQSNAPGLSPNKKQQLQERARGLLSEAQKAEKTDCGCGCGGGVVINAEMSDGRSCCTKCGTCGNYSEITKRYARIVKNAPPPAGEEHYVLGIVLEPDIVDAQGDTYSADDVRKAAHRYMEFFAHMGLMHKEIVDGDIRILESYLSPTEFEVDGMSVKKGTWLLAARVVSDRLWDKVKKGEFTGWSIGGNALREPVSQLEAARIPDVA
jgi:putative serine protease XkdF